MKFKSKLPIVTSKCFKKSIIPWNENICNPNPENWLLFSNILTRLSHWKINIIKIIEVTVKILITVFLKYYSKINIIENKIGYNLDSDDKTIRDEIR